MAEVKRDVKPLLLANAGKQARQRGLYDFPIVDVDAHYHEVNSWKEIIQYVDVRSLRLAIQRTPLLEQILPGTLGIRGHDVKVMRDPFRGLKEVDDDAPDLIQHYRMANRELGVDYAIVFPTAMLLLGVHPQVEMEVAIARAFARWMTERVLTYDSGVRTMLYLPLNDPDASLQLIEEFGHRKGVVGFLVTSVRHAPIYANRYMKVFRAIEESGMPLAFHPITHWQERPLEQLNRFLTVHALGFPLYNMTQISNIIINGLPERFPNIKWIFLECGLSYIIFLMHRLDGEYLMRPQEAPLLKKRPSEYLREFYYGTQPLESTESPDDLRWLIEKVGGPARLLYSSDYPHWDWDPPSRIYDLPFLSEADKRLILGGNAMRLFGLGNR